MIEKIEYIFTYNLSSALKHDEENTGAGITNDNLSDDIIRKLSSSQTYRWKISDLNKLGQFFEKINILCNMSWNDFDSGIMSMKYAKGLFKAEVNHHNADIVFTVRAEQPQPDEMKKLEEIIDQAAAATGLPVYKYIHDSRSSKAYSISDGKFSKPLSGFIGVDVGSISTNVVFVDGNHNVIEFVYTYTRGRVLDALKAAFMQMKEKLPDNARIQGVGVTGSSGELAKSILKADIYRTEIYSHAAATIHQLPEVKSILEIGGQDSKVIYVNGGIPEKSKMNEWCGAGTGAMLDAEAARMGIDITELGDYALRAKKAINFRTRCGVFMASCMIDAQAHGYPIEVIIAGLCKACASNYVNTLGINRKTLEHPMVFQGGVASNKGVKKQLEDYISEAQDMQCTLLVPVYHHVMGAIGMGIIAGKNFVKTGIATGFRGFDGIHGIVSELEVCDHSACTRYSSRESFCDIIRLRTGGTTIATIGACDEYPREKLKDE